MSNKNTGAARYPHLYNTTAWRRLRQEIIDRAGNSCTHCGIALISGKKAPASAVVHHITPHKGDATLFHSKGNLEAVCKRCHDGHLKATEARGYSTAIGADGWPSDANHPGIKIY